MVSNRAGNSRIELSITELFEITRSTSDERRLRDERSADLQREQNTAISTLEEKIQVIYDDQARDLEVASNERSRDSSTLAAILEKTVPLHQLTRLHKNSVEMIHDTLSDDAERTERAFSAVMTRLSPVTDIASAQQKSLELLYSILDAVTTSKSPLSRRDSNDPFCSEWTDRKSGVITPYSNTVGVRVAQPVEVSCVVGCSCRCHTRQSVKSPPILTRMIGSFFMGYTGHPTQLQSCSEALCQRRSSFSVQLTYLFPQWFMMKMIAITVARNKFGDLSYHPKVARVVPANAKIFSYISTGDVSGIRDLFSRGLASPSDIRSESGITPLAVSLPLRIL